jgi:hypothetical protein
VITAAGLLFEFVGAGIIIDYVIGGGGGPDGDLPAGTPLFIRATGFVVGLTILGLMTAVFGWIAFGPGPRAFSTTVVLPFLAQREGGDPLAGRIGFAIGTLLLGLMFVVCGTVGIRRLVHARRSHPRRRPTL